MSAADLLKKLKTAIEAEQKAAPAVGTVYDLAKVSAGNVDRHLADSNKFKALQELLKEGRITEEMFKSNADKLRGELQQQIMAKSRTLPKAGLTDEVAGATVVPGAKIAAAADRVEGDGSSALDWLPQGVRDAASTVHEKLLKVSAVNPFDLTRKTLSGQDSAQAMRVAKQQQELAKMFADENLPSPKDVARAASGTLAADPFDFGPQQMRQRVEDTDRQEAEEVLKKGLMGASQMALDPTMYVAPEAKLAGVVAPKFARIGKIFQGSK